MSRFPSMTLLKYSSIAIPITIICVFMLHSLNYRFDDEPKRSAENKWVEKKSTLDSSSPGKNDTLTQTIPRSTFGPLKAPSIFSKIQHPKSWSKSHSKPIAPVKRNEDCYSYTHGMKLLSKEMLIKNKCSRRLPKAMIVGVKKCGTMTLQTYLHLHISIAINGEIDFPQGDDFTAKDVEKWRNRMLYSSPRMFTMTEKPGYIRTSLESMRLMKSFLDDDLKLIVIIRDPVVRAVSDYVHKLTVLFRDSFQRLPHLSNSTFSITYRDDDLRETFQKTVINLPTGKVREHQSIVQLGRYIGDLNRLMEVYNRSQLLILDGNAFIEDPFPILRRIEDFLGIPKFYQRDHFRKNPKTDFFCAHVPERPRIGCANPSIKGRPHPTVDEETIKKLRDYYRPFNLELAKEFDLNFSWLFQ